MSLYVRIETSFYTHRKTLRLRSILGDDAFWVPPRLWSYAAANQPDGDFDDYTCKEIADLICYAKDAKAMLQALLAVRFMDAKPLRIHDWHQYNGILDFFSKRAKKAADARWQKERTKEKGSEQSRSEQSRSEASIAPSNASSILELTGERPKKPDCYPPEARVALFYLNEKSGRRFTENDPNLKRITARLKECGGDIAGIRNMIDRQCLRWLGTDMAEYLRPETLFGKEKFDGYFAARDLPLETAKAGASTQSAHPWDNLSNYDREQHWKKANPGASYQRYMDDVAKYEDARDAR